MRLRTLVTHLLVGAAFAQAFAQEGKTNRKGERIGEWLIVCAMKEGGVEHFPNSDLVDWSASLVPVDDETYAGIAQKRAISTHGENLQSVYIESCEYRDGLKQGPFNVKYYPYRAGSGIDVANGKTMLNGLYVNGMLHGKVSMGDSYADGIRACEIEYDNGRVVDQTIVFQYASYGHVNLPSVNQIIGATPYMTIAAGKVVEDFREIGKNQNDKKWCRTMHLSATEQVEMRYSVTAPPLRYCTFGKEEVDWISKGFAYTEVLCNRYIEGKWSYSGPYRVFLVADHVNNNASVDIAQFADTTQLVASFSLVKSQLHGPASIWRRGQNGKSGDSPWMTVEYQNHRLSGLAKMHFGDGKLAVVAEFWNGSLDGLVEIYGASDERYWPYHLGTKVKGSARCMNAPFFEGTIVPMRNWLQIIADKGEALNTESPYGLYARGVYKPIEVEGEVYSMPASDIEYYWDGKRVAKLVANPEDIANPKDVLFYDNSGKLVYSVKQIAGEILRNEEERQKEKERLLKEPFTCAWCSRESIMKNAVMWIDCKCFDRVDEPVEIAGGLVGKWFCSRACASEANKSCCTQSGYHY